eukprot:CAMPEP_0195071966 /NCGR_PEP_ID=MMETSP0448-20130528/15648_1 /TAXON_ID=66468 /ORGANISM="Heterocapsa triquestra, Strain CCMP 448" /LENGTH=32 /DNA_ID= /DNA_START= /DNA_END= /DNA_ORIENTATION=
MKEELGAHQECMPQAHGHGLPVGVHNVVLDVA